MGSLWMFLNFALNFFNKWAFTKVEDGGAGFSFPIFYTMWNTLASFCGANLLMLLGPVNRTISWKQVVDNKFALLVFGVVFSSNIVTNNASLVYISLSVNQVIKCLVPIPAIIFSYFIEKKSYSYPILGASLVLTFGACMSIPWDSPKVTPIGSFLALWSTAMSGLRPVLTALLLKNSKESGLTPVPLLWYDAGFSTIFLFLAFLVSEETVTVSAFFKEDTMEGILILIAVLLWDKSISPISIVGFVIFFCGLFGYSYMTFKSRARGTTRPAEPVAATGAKETTKLVSS